MAWLPARNSSARFTPNNGRPLRTPHPLLVGLLGLGALVACNVSSGGSADDDSGFGNAAQGSSSGGGGGGQQGGSSNGGGGQQGGSSNGGGGQQGGSSNGGAGNAASSSGGNVNEPVTQGSVITFGGAQDFGFFRQELEAGRVPRSGDMDSPGFFAEHHTSLPPPDCGRDVCLQGLMAVGGNLINGAACTLAQVALNSPIVPANLPQLPLRLVLVVDESGSMSGRNLQMVHHALTLLAGELDAGDKYAIVGFGSGVSKQGGWKDYNALDWNRDVQALDAEGGSTNIRAGLERGLELMLDEGGGIDTGFQNRLILLSDGVANAGNTSAGQMVDLAASAAREGVGFTTVGVGTAYDPALMSALAEGTGGSYFFADSDAALAEIFLEEVRSFVVPVAFDVTISVDSGAYYELRATYGANQFTTDNERRSGSITIPAVTLAHRQAHDDNQNGRRGGGSALLLELMPSRTPQAYIASAPPGLEVQSGVSRLHLRYFSVQDQQYHEETRVLEYQAGPNVLLPDGYFSHDAIQKNFVMLNLFVGFRMGADLFHAQRYPEALATLDALMAAVNSWNMEIADEDIADDLRLMGLMRQSIQAADEASRPAEQPENPWPND